MNIALNLNRKEAQAVLRADLVVGWGLRRSVALRTAEMKLRQAIINALQPEDEP